MEDEALPEGQDMGGPQMPEEEENVDRELAVEAGVALLFNEEGSAALLQAAQKNDPVEVAAKTIVVVMAQVRDKFKQDGMTLDDNVFIGDEGAPAELLLYVFKLFEKELDMPKFGEEAYEQAMDIMEQDAAQILKAEQQGQQAPPPQQAGPSQGAPPQGIAGRLQGGAM